MISLVFTSRVVGTARDLVCRNSQTPGYIHGQVAMRYPHLVKTGVAAAELILRHLTVVSRSVDSQRVVSIGVINWDC